MWATVWYAGAVVLTIGHPNITLDHCNQMIALIRTDIYESYELEGETLEDMGYKKVLWDMSCEPVALEIGYKK